MVDKTMMGDKCAELVRAAMIGALAVTLGNPTAVYAAEEVTADPGQIGIEIAGEAAVGAASFCVEEDAAEEAPAEAEEVTESEGTQNDEMEEESGSEGKEDETVPEEPEPQEPDGGENAGMTEPGKTGETEPEGPENAEPGEAGETEPEEPENPEPGDQGDMPETPGNSEMDGPWPGEGEDISNDPWPGQEEIGGGDGEQMEPPEEENGSAGSDDAAGGDKTAEVSSDSDLSQSAEPPAAEAEPVFSAEQEAERTRESYSEWQAAEAEKKESGIKILGGGCAKCNALEAATVDALRELGMDTTIDHVRDFEKIAAYGVMTTPALVVDGQVVSYGKVLKKDEVIVILKKESA